jgi:hypothetical protein
MALAKGNLGANFITMTGFFVGLVRSPEHAVLLGAILETASVFTRYWWAPQ